MLLRGVPPNDLTAGQHLCNFDHKNSMPLTTCALAQALRALAPLVTPDTALLGLRMADRHLTYSKYCAFWVSACCCIGHPHSCHLTYSKYCAFWGSACCCIGHPHVSQSTYCMHLLYAPSVCTFCMHLLYAPIAHFAIWVCACSCAVHPHNNHLIPSHEAHFLCVLVVWLGIRLSCTLPRTVVR